MSEYTASPPDDAASISNQPLIPKASEPKDYEAAAAALMSSYGFPGGVSPAPTVPDKTKKKSKKTKTKKEVSTDSDQAGQSSAPSSTTPANK